MNTGNLKEFAKWDSKLDELREKLRKSALTERNLQHCVDRLIDVVRSARQSFLDRDDAIRVFVACAMARVPVLLLGPPGTAKSLIVRRVARLCGVNTKAGESGYFEYLLNQYTMPEELFGPPDISQLTGENAVFVRNTKGRLPEANFVFLDEIFRGSGHILNTLLSVVNERRFHDGRTIQAVPLVAVAGAANSVNLDDDLAAFFDRFPIRVWVDSVFDRAGSDLRHTAERLLAKEWRLDHGNGDDRIACLSDFVAVQEHLVAGEWQPPAAFLDAFLTFRGEAQLSDRTLYTLSRVGRALSLLESDSQHDPEYLLEVFKYTSPTRSEAERLTERVDQFLRGHERTGVV